MKFLSTTIIILVCLTGHSQSTFRLQTGGPFTERYLSVIQLSQGDIVAAGISLNNGQGMLSEYFVSRITSDGQVKWTRYYGGNSDEFWGYVAKGLKGDLWLCGSTWSFGNGYDDIFVLKLDENGDVLFDTTYGGPNLDWPAGICSTSDGGIAIVGTTLPDSTVRDSEVSLTKLDALGRLEFQKHFGGPIFDYGKAVIQTDDGGYIVAGNYDAAPSTQHDFDLRFFLVRTDRFGDTLWTKRLLHPSLPSIMGGQPREIIRLGDGSYVAIGDMAVRFWADGQIEWIDGGLGGNAATAVGPSDFLLAHEISMRRLDKDRNLIWTVFMDDFFPDAMCISPDSGIVMAGFTEATGSPYLDGLVLKTNCEGKMVDSVCLPDPVNPALTTPLEIRIGPNPAQGFFSIDIRGLKENESLAIAIHDVRGRLVAKIANLQNGVRHQGLDGMIPGLYIVSSTVGERLIQRQKLILQK